MVDHNCTTTGFTFYDNEPTMRLLLPIHLVEQLKGHAELAAQHAAAEKRAAATRKADERTQFVQSKSRHKSHPNVDILQKIDCNIATIRTGTKYDLSDAMTLASRLLATSTAGLDRVSAQLSNDLFIAICLDLAYAQLGGNLIDVLNFLRDPLWENNAQIVVSFRIEHKAFQQTDTAVWLKSFSSKILALESDELDSLIENCYRHWTSVGQSAGRSTKRTKARGDVQVFDPHALEKAVVRIKELKDDRRAAGERILQQAHANNGKRTLPNPKVAYAKLEAAKSRFENLIEPITRLQMDLILSSAKKTAEFRITPLLLLGEPGIGKTFLATQLADALGVSTEKISAGGAQSGFQLTGSHSTWLAARPGMLFSLLAEGGSAAPVVVIDEVEKIRDAQFPVLPVLLDLLDAQSSQQFKDEFYELQFDASRIIFVMTANSIEDVPPALLSRVEVFDVPPPQPAQRLRIIQETVTQLCRATRRRIQLDQSTSDALSKRLDIDLRRVTRLVNEAYTRAMQTGDDVAVLSLPKRVEKRRIGFH